MHKKLTCLRPVTTSTTRKTRSISIVSKPMKIVFFCCYFWEKARKKIWSKKLWLKKLRLKNQCFKKCTYKKSTYKNILGTQILGAKNLSKKNLAINIQVKKIWSKHVWSKKYLGQKKFDPKRNLGPEKLLLPKKFVKIRPVTTEILLTCTNLTSWPTTR